MKRSIAHAVLSLGIVAVLSFPTAGQSPAVPLLERAAERPQNRGLSIAASRAGSARVNGQALSAERIELSLFEDAQLTARRTSRSHPRDGSTVWHGRLEAPHAGEVTLALVDGALSGSITADGRMFEVSYAGDGVHEVREVNPALFPTEDPPIPAGDLVSASGSSTVSSNTPTSSDTAGQIDVMVVWTPAARNANGGTAAGIQSVVDLAVANANAAYANSGINTRLRLVYAGEVSFTETPSNISGDLSRLQSGGIPTVHNLRNQYGADIVSLFGSGYAGAGYCGIGYLMSSVSSSFASNAFNVVDQTCAGGYLSYAHEVGHNQGLHHDPANASGSGAYSYAYGYQDPGGMFRTVMSYGGAARVQHFSNPNVLYGDRSTGSDNQNNAEALNRTAATVANFRSSSSSGSCSYSVTPTTLAFSDSGGTATIQVTAPAGCAWSTGSGAGWISVGPGGSGSGSVTVTAAANPGEQRSSTATVAGVTISITEAAAPAATPPACTFTLSGTSFSLPSTGGTIQVEVTTTPECSWNARSNAGWLKVSGAATGPGVASLQVTKGAGSSRTATALVAGQTVSVTQAGSRK
jgi:hypothetical protein